MKALSIKQPWAWHIISAPSKTKKDVENRDWITKFRGTVAVHASQTAVDDLDQLALVKSDPERFIQGAIIGIVDIVDVVTEHDSEWFEGKFGFVLRNARALKEPISIKGKLKFWEVPEDVEAEILNQLDLHWYLRK